MTNSDVTRPNEDYRSLGGTRIVLSAAPAWPATRPTGWSSMPAGDWSTTKGKTMHVAPPRIAGAEPGDAAEDDEQSLTAADLARVKNAERKTREILQKYRAAMREMMVRCEIIDQDLSLKKHRNPIHHVESRIKSPESIFEKLGRYGKEPTLENMERYIMDIAGIRIICSYIQDVYNMLDLLKRQDDLIIVNVKDYIKNPKPNGYRSLHVIIRIPVYFLDKKELIPVEIQLRTIAMDFWASLEHDLKYKAVRRIQGIDSYHELKDCSRIIEEVESRMQILARALDADDED